MKTVTKVDKQTSRPSQINNPTVYQNKRISWVDILKGIGIILVVLGHIYKNEHIYNWIYSFHMPLFFFAAGYVYKKKNILEDLKKRAQSVLVPYFIFGIIGLVYWLLLERRFRESTMSSTEAIIGLFRGQENTLDFNVHLWFLPCFFVTAVLFNLLINLIDEKWTIVVVIGISIFYTFLWDKIPSLPWGIDWICKYIFFFLAGHSIRYKDVLTNRIISQKTKWFFLGLLLLCLEAISVFYFGNSKFLWFINASLALAGLSIITAVLGKSRLLEYLGRCTIVILCIHGPLYRVFIKALSIVIKSNTEVIRNNIALSILIAILTLSCCSVIYQLIIWLFPWIIGRKKQIKKYGGNEV